MGPNDTLHISWSRTRGQAGSDSPLTRRDHRYIIFKKFNIFEAACLPVGSVNEAVLPVGGTVIPDRLYLSRDRAVLQHCQTQQKQNNNRNENDEMRLARRLQTTLLTKTKRVRHKH